MYPEQHRLRSGNPEAGIMFKTWNNTQACYIKTVPQQSIAAMQTLEMLVDRSRLICNESANEAAARRLVQ